MTADQDDYAVWDAAYVLGALSSTERREFEAHLRSCERCAAAIAELAAMPALLGRVPAADARALGDRPPARTPDPLPALAHRVRRHRRVRRIGAVTASAAALVVAVLLVVLLRPPMPTVEVPLTATVDGPLAAEVDLVAEPWGTRLEMTCTYRAGTAAGDGPWPYELVVADRAGRERVVATWQAGAGETVHATSAVENPVADIASIAIRSTRSGTVLLRGEPRGAP